MTALASLDALHHCLAGTDDLGQLMLRPVLLQATPSESPTQRFVCTSLLRKLRHCFIVVWAKRALLEHKVKPCFMNQRTLRRLETGQVPIDGHVRRVPALVLPEVPGVS